MKPITASMLPGAARQLSTLVSAAALCIGCAQTQLTVRGSGSSDTADSLRVTNRTKLSLVFGTDSLDSTKVRSRDGYVAATVNIVEVDADHLLVKSDKWPSVADLPASYLKNPEVFVTARHFRYGRPTVRIPLRAVQEIIVAERHYRSPQVLTRLSAVPRWIWQGAAVGMAVVLGYRSPWDPATFYRVDRYDLDYQDAKAAATVGAIGGATLNTLGRLFWPEVEYDHQSYHLPPPTRSGHGNQ